MKVVRCCDRCGKSLEEETCRVGSTCESCWLAEVDAVEELNDDLERWGWYAA